MLTDDEVKAAFSANVSRLLEEQGHSIYWLRKEIGVGEGTIYPIVRGKVVPSVAISSRIAEALGVAIDDLIEPAVVSSGRKK